MDAAHPHERVICVAPNGGRRTRSDHPAMPISPADLARTAAECLDAGAAMIHVHVRDSQGRHLLDVDAYNSAILSIRAEVGDRLVIQITTEALGVYSPQEQARVLQSTRPEAASLALREFWPEGVSEKTFVELLNWMAGHDVLPQIILYEAAEAVRLGSLRDRGALPWWDIPVLYVLGRYTVSQTSQPTDLLPFIAAEMPRFSNWSVCAFGAQEAACVAASALLGGHVRVGFENNFYLPSGATAEQNAALVDAIATPVRALGYTLMDAAGARQLFFDTLRKQ